MTDRETNLYKRCTVCIRCGRCSADGGIQVLDSGAEALWRDAGPEGLTGYVAVADIGTTTVAMVLRRLSDGRQTARHVALNPQRSFGADVMSRITAASAPCNRESLRRLIRQVLEEGLHIFRTVLEREHAGEAADIRRLYIAANTAMVYFLMGYDAGSLGMAPYTAAHLAEIKTELAGIETVILPGLDAFVGADITAGIYALSIQEREDISLLIDLGTNGEMVLGARGRLLTTATAAGPAFEGGLTDGLFGADIIALLAKAMRMGLVDDTGLIREPYFEEGILVEDIRISQKDIRQLQLAKAAVAAGIQILCKQYGITDMAQIKSVYLAGGFVYYLDAGAAIAVGLLPLELRGRVQAAGNTALEGAYRYGRDKEAGIAADKLRDILENVRCVNLAMQEEFGERYVDNMNLEPVKGIY